MRECTPALFNQVVDNEKTARVCAEIEDALEKVKLKKKKKNAIFPTHRKMPEMAQNWFPGKCS